MATQFNFEAIGTTWQIDIYKELSSEKKSELLSLIMKRIDDFDVVYSRFREDSLVTKMSKEAGLYILPPDSKELFELYFDLYKKTDGHFTPLIGNMISDAGYDATYSLVQKKELQSPQKWEDAIEYKDSQIKIKTPIILDFGAGGKGYLVDLVAKVLEKNDAHEYCIDAGGDIIHKNSTPIRVGLENPFDTKQVVGVCDLLNESICGSAGTRRAWGEFTHIMNPKTLASPKEIVAVWVVAKSALLADCIATCLFFVDAMTLLDTYEFEYVIIKSDHSIERSTGFKGEIFS